MTTEPKKRAPRIPTATQTADRIDRAIREFIEYRAGKQAEILEHMAACPESERSSSVRVLNVLRDDLCGFSLDVKNDASPSPDVSGGGGEELPNGAAGEGMLPAGALPLDSAREERIGRITGAKR